jgi:hypothetical protein
LVGRAVIRVGGVGTHHYVAGNEKAPLPSTFGRNFEQYSCLWRWLVAGKAGDLSGAAETPLLEPAPSPARPTTSFRSRVGVCVGGGGSPWPSMW